jgi:photosystem II stability/assembly factor-like uncharacterized protein
MTAKNGLLNVALSVGLSLLFLGMALPASAGINQWTSNGPNGEHVFALAIDPGNTTRIYAATIGGVYRSTDRGGSWTNAGLDGVFALAIDPNAPVTIYAGTGGGGVYKTTDGGVTWGQINTGLANLFVYSLAIDPSNPATIYAGTSGGVYKSTNCGESWINTGLTEGAGVINTLAIDPSTPSNIFAGSYNGVYKSTNGGGNWNQINTGLTDTWVFTLVIDPTTPATIYAGTGGGGVYKPSYGGVFKSTNGGEGWSQINSGLTDTDVHELAIDPVTPTILYAGTDVGGVFKSLDGGDHWSQINAGLTNTDIYALAVDHVTPANIYAGTYGAGIFSRTEVPYAPVPTGLAVSAPISVTSGNALNFTVTSLDQFGNTATGYSGTVRFTSSDGAAVFPADATLTNGVGTFTATLKTAGDRTITATDTVTASITGTSGNIHVTPAATTHFSLTAPASAIAGTLANFTVTALDQFGNTVTGYAGTVRFTSSDGSAVLPSDATLTNGVGTFQATLNTIGARTIAATDTVTSSITGTSGTIQVIPPTASTNRWTGNGPYGGHIKAFAIDSVNPASIYAGSYGGGVYKSTDGGGNWSQVNAGLTDAHVYSLAIDPANPSTVYAGTWKGGVFKSSDGGASWNNSSTGLTSVSILALAIDPGSPSTIYAGTLDGVFKSTDGGRNWGPSSTGLADTVQALAIDPSTPSTIYAGAYGGVYKSTNGGTNWSQIFSGQTIPGVSALAIDPSAPSTVYAGTWYGAYKSTDGGESWNPINTGLSTYYQGEEVAKMVLALAIDPSAPATVYAATDSAGVYKSANGGGNWARVKTGMTVTYVPALVIDPSAPSTVFAGTGGGVYKSSNGGVSWEEANSGMRGASVTAVATDPLTPGTLYAGSYGGVYKSTDGGYSWNRANTGLTNTKVRSLAVDPLTPTTIYAGTFGGGVFKSTNGGEGWSEANTGLTTIFEGEFVHMGIYSLAIDPVTPATIYAGTLIGGVFKTTDGGTSWAQLTSGPINQIYTLAIDPATPSTVYAASENIFKSSAGGSNWEEIGSGIPYAVHALAIDPSHTSTIYAGSYGSVYRSTIGGGSWSPVSAGISNDYINTLAIDRYTSNIYAGTLDRGVYRSTDGGVSWGQINGGLTNIQVRTITIAPSFPATIYAGTEGGGVFSRTEVPYIPVPTSFSVTAPASAAAGVPLTFAVTALDQFGNTASGYTGTVHFTSSDGAAVLPADALLTNGTGTFTATLNSTGSRTIAATDTVTSSITGTSADIVVVAGFKLTISFAGSGSGTVTSTSPDSRISCVKGSSNGCSANYLPDASVTLAATGDWRSSFTGWSDGVAGSSNPVTFTMDGAKNVTAGFTPNLKAKLLPGDTLFASIQDAYASVSSGSITIQAQVHSFLENLLFGSGTEITLTGGMNSDYSQASGYSTVKSLTVGRGSVVIGNIVVK